jgi:hypothetical protein
MRWRARVALSALVIGASIRLVSRLALRAFVERCARVPVYAFMPVECELLLWAVMADASLHRIASAQFLATFL